MKHMIINPHQGLPVSMNLVMRHIIESQNKLQCENAALSSRLHALEQEKLTLESDMIEVWDGIRLYEQEVQRLQALLAGRGRTCSDRIEEPSNEHFFRPPRSHFSRIVLPLQPPKATPLKTAELPSRTNSAEGLAPLNDTCITPKRSQRRSNSLDSQLGTSAHHRPRHKQRSASLSGAGLAAFSDDDARDQPQQPRSSSIQSIQISPPAAWPISPLQSTYLQSCTGRASMANVCGSQTRLPSPAHRCTIRPIGRRERSDSSLQTVYRICAGANNGRGYGDKCKRNSSSSSQQSVPSDTARSAAQAASKRLLGR